MFSVNRLPSFVVAGAQKSGTTWLFECMDEHPQIYVPHYKEIHYFCPRDRCRFSTYNKGSDWYREQFVSGENIKALGDLTTDYMYYPQVAQKLYELNKDLRIVFLLRDPVSRAYSAYWMWRRHNRDLPEFNQILHGGKSNAMDNSLVDRGMYYRQIKPYLDLFGESQVRIYIYEEIFRDLDQFFDDIFDFIGVDNSFRPLTMRKRIAETKDYPGILGKLVYKGGATLLNSPAFRPVWKWIRRRTNLKETLLDLLGYKSSEQYYPALPDEARIELQNIFSVENEKLKHLLGREKDIWEY